VLKVDCTTTCTFSLAIDDSLPENGCLRYVVGSGRDKILRPHYPLAATSSTSSSSSTAREESHALVMEVNADTDEIRLAPAKRGSVTIHDEYVVHGSAGNTSPDKQRRTYVVAYRAAKIVQAERSIGFTHSHNDKVNWDTFDDGESHRVGNHKMDLQPQVNQEE
jgi:phytanoyl-CoA hydroxylase